MPHPAQNIACGNVWPHDVLDGELCISIVAPMLGGFDNRGMTWQRSSCNISCTETTTSCFRHTLDALHYKSPPYSTRYPLLPTIYDDHPCLPLGNVIEDNRYCHKNSKGGGKFLDRDAATIVSWRSAASNNVEDCSGTE